MEDQGGQTEGSQGISEDGWATPQAGSGLLPPLDDPFGNSSSSSSSSKEMRFIAANPDFSFLSPKSLAEEGAPGVPGAPRELPPLS